MSVNITNAYLYMRSDTAANFTSANTPLGNTTLNAAELAFERDTRKIKIGIGNWTTVGYMANAADVSAVAANVTTLQGNITTINANVANKADTSHTHNATTAFSGGIVPTARLGTGTANSSTVLYGDNVWRTVSANGTSNGTSRGFFFDTRDYGLSAGGDAANNTAAVQAAIDAAAVQSGGNGGGTVYFPATENQPGTRIRLRTPAWVHGSNIKIQGEGSQATVLEADGPAFVISKHPRFWDLWKSTYASDGASTTGTVSGETNWINVQKCKPDLYEFRSAGSFPPTNGNPAFAPSTITGTGQYFGIRTQKGVAQARWPYCPMGTGDQTQSNQSADLWPFHSKLTWEFVVYHHEANMCGAIAGAGGVATPGSGPDPWILYGAAGDYYFELAMTDVDMVERTWFRFNFPMNDTIGIHRVCVQFDPDNADSAKRVVAYVDGVQKTVTPSAWQWFHGGNYSPVNPSAYGVDGGTTGLWTRWNRVARWVESDFTVGSESSKVAFYASDQAPYLTDYTVLAVAVHSELLYNVNGTGTSQTKIVDGTAADDSYVWAHTSGNFSRTKTIGWMANSFSWSPNSDTTLNVNAMCRGKSGSEVWGYLCPKGDANNWDGYAAVDSPAIEGIRIRQKDAFPVSCAILNGPWINTYRIEDFQHDFGYYASIGAMFHKVSYYGRWTNLKLGKMVHLIHQTVEGERWDWGYANVCALRICGSEFRLKNFSYPAPEANDEGFLSAFSAGSLGAGIVFEDGTINQEGLQFAPLIAVFYLQKNYAHGNNSLTIRNVQVGEVNAPIFYFDDLYPQDPRGTSIDIQRAGFGAYGPICIARGKEWYGEIEVHPTTYMTDQVTSLAPFAGISFCDIKTVDRESYGLPPTGGFTANCHEIHVRNPAPGAPAVWRVTSTGKEGSANVPTWSAVRLAEANTPTTISANIYPGFRANCVLQWPNATNTTWLDFTSLTNQFANATLNTILANATAANRTQSRLKWGYINAYTVTNGTYGTWDGVSSWDGTFFSGNSTLNSSLWANATSASKSTNVVYNTAGRDPDGDPGGSWTVYGRYKWVWAMEIGDGTTMRAAFVGRTTVREPSHWAVSTANTPQVASGALTLTRVNRPGNWTNYAANQILDFMVGGTLSLGTTWHFGLSATTVSTTAGTGITEPTSGSYARVPVTRNATNWGELFDSEYIYSNKVAIEFPAPTGDWGLLTDWFISDASSGGNIIAAGKLNRPIRVFNGDPRPTFQPGAFQVQL